MSDASENAKRPRQQTVHQVFLRGLAISLPAILTIVILLWLLGGISTYIINPTTTSVKYVIALFLDRSVDPQSAQLVRLKDGPPLAFCGENYLITEQLLEDYAESFRIDSKGPADTAGGENANESEDVVAALEEYFGRIERRSTWIEQRIREEPRLELFASLDSTIFVPIDGRAVPYVDYAVVARDTPPGTMPTSVTGLYMEYAVRRYVGSAFTLSVFAVSLVIVAIYFLGRFVSVRLGSWVVGQVEDRLLGRLPVIRNVYGSAKQVTEFLFSENQVEYRRVVAVEYPRRGLWSLGLVTGEGMLEITTAVGEPCVSLLIPSSPMPVTGYTMCVPRSAVLDLDITVDQAFQFCISCGVLVPKNQKVTAEVLERELTKRLAERMRESPVDRRPQSTLPAPEPDGDDVGSQPS